MSLVWPLLIVVACAGLGISAMLLVRRGAPEGSYFSDGDRASGVFGVVATGFSVLLGFVVFLAFTSYDDTKQGAETEALVVAQQFETAQFMPAAQREGAGRRPRLLRGVRRAPRVAAGSEAGTQGDAFNPWGVALFRTLEGTATGRPDSRRRRSSKWLDQTSERGAARQDRIHAAEGVVLILLN